MTRIFQVGNLYFADLHDAYDSVAADELRNIRELAESFGEDDDGYGEQADEFERRIQDAGSINALAWLGMQGDPHSDCHQYLKRVKTIILTTTPLDLRTRKPIPALQRF